MENRSLLTSVFASSLSANLIERAQHHVRYLVLPKVELHLISWVASRSSELKQLGCFALLLCQHRLLLFRQVGSVMPFPPQNGDDVIRRRFIRLPLKQCVMIRRKLFLC